MVGHWRENSWGSRLKQRSKKGLGKRGPPKKLEGNVAQVWTVLTEKGKPKKKGPHTKGAREITEREATQKGGISVRKKWGKLKNRS